MRLSSLLELAEYHKNNKALNEAYNASLIRQWNE